MNAGNRLVGLLRSLAVYHAIPLRQRRLRALRPVRLGERSRLRSRCTCRKPHSSAGGHRVPGRRVGAAARFRASAPGGFRQGPASRDYRVGSRRGRGASHTVSQRPDTHHDDLGRRVAGRPSPAASLFRRTVGPADLGGDHDPRRAHHTVRDASVRQDRCRGGRAECARGSQPPSARAVVRILTRRPRLRPSLFEPSGRAGTLSLQLVTRGDVSAGRRSLDERRRAGLPPSTPSMGSVGRVTFTRDASRRHPSASVRYGAGS